MILGLALQFPLLKAGNAGVLDCSGDCSVSLLTKGLQGPGTAEWQEKFILHLLTRPANLWVGLNADTENLLYP